MVSNETVVLLIVQTDGVDDAKVTARFEEAVADRDSLVRAACEAGVGNVTVCELSPTATETELLMTVPCDAVMVEEPCATPVTVVPLIVTAVPVAENVGVIANDAPYWSTPLTDSVAVPLTLMLVGATERLRAARWGGTCETVMLKFTGDAAA